MRCWSRRSDTTYQRFGAVEAGATASLVVGGAPSATPSWGWISLNTPFPVQVQEAGRVVGTSEIERIMLPPGTISSISSPTRSASGRLEVDYRRDAERPVSLTIPRVAMNINALPVGGSFRRRHADRRYSACQRDADLGEHEIVFRHPQLGEKRQVARVTLKDSPRISVDMRTK